MVTSCRHATRRFAQAKITRRGKDVWFQTRKMSVGPFCVGLVVSTVNVAFLLRHIKYRTELCTYGYLEGNRPFSSKTPFTDSKDYRLVSVEERRGGISFILIHMTHFQEMWHRIRQEENSTAGDLANYSHTVTTKIRSNLENLFNAKFPWSKN
jgi:hypothetical protein